MPKPIPHLVIIMYQIDRKCIGRQPTTKLSKHILAKFHTKEELKQNDRLNKRKTMVWRCSHHNLQTFNIYVSRKTNQTNQNCCYDKKPFVALYMNFIIGYQLSKFSKVTSDKKQEDKKHQRSTKTILIRVAIRELVKF